MNVVLLIVSIFSRTKYMKKIFQKIIIKKKNIKVKHWRKKGKEMIMRIEMNFKLIDKRRK